MYGFHLGVQNELAKASYTGNTMRLSSPICSRSIRQEPVSKVVGI